jgi:hypothetical protein
MILCGRGSRRGLVEGVVVLSISVAIVHCPSGCSTVC